jgi:hypothetical protein
MESQQVSDSRWFDMNLVRWQHDTMQAVDGWNRKCSNCYGLYWPSVTSHPEWCAMCAGTNDSGRFRRHARAEEKKASEQAEK